jgi:hypothetical protein
MDNMNIEKYWEMVCNDKYGCNYEDTLRDELCKLLIEKEYKAFPEKHYNKLWSDSELKLINDHFPNDAKGTDVVVFEKNSKSLVRSTGIELKFIKTIKKDEELNEIIHESCFFCTNNNTKSSCPIEGPKFGDKQYIVKYNGIDTFTYHKEGQIIWDLCRGARVKLKNFNTPFYLCLLIKVPNSSETICENCPNEQFFFKKGYPTRATIERNINTLIKDFVKSTKTYIVRESLQKKITPTSGECSVIENAKILKISDAITPKYRPSKNYGLNYFAATLKL